jgi:putative nucleotidyltransferase with HDIG domain
MIGYYRLTDKQIKELPKNAQNIEENIYNVCYPLIIGEELPKDLYYLYETLEIPIIKYEELQNVDLSTYKKHDKKLAAFSSYLKLNQEIELLEEGKIGHTLRVGRYALELCKLLNLDKEETKEIYLGAIFHDIGKTNIPKKILSKPGKLTEKEFEIIKTHCEKGVEILDDFFNKNILDMILNHHERCDKSGYPNKIEPNLGAKIIGIADSYDAMTSNRVYKKNKSLKAAQEELVRCSLDKVHGGIGKLYDETMVRKFVSYHGYNLLAKKYNKYKTK